MEEDGQTTPFWLQSSTYFQSSNHHHPHRRRRLSSVCLNSGFLIVVLSIVGLITIFFVVPSFLSFTSQVFRPNLVKKSWDNVNLVLVLFAIFCGILGRKRDDGESNGDVGIPSNAAPVSEEPLQQPVQQQQQQQWYGYSDQGIHMPNNSNMVGSLRRNSSSYPDLRQESSWVSPADQNWRFYDDNYVYNQRLGSSSVYRRKQRQEEDVAEDLGVKTIPVDRYVVSQQKLSSPPPLPASPPTLSPPRHSTPPPPPPAPPRPTSEKKHKARQTFESVPHEEHSKSKEMEFKKIESPTRQPSPPPQSPPEITKRSEKKAKKHERKKSGGAKEIASSLASLYNQRKRKKKHNSKENFDDIFQSPSYTHSGPPPSPPPPPPPPPPPASVFHQLFKKGSKGKRIHSFSASSSIQRQKQPPPPPPPLPPMSPLRSSKRKPQTQHPMPQPPPPPPPPAPPSEFSRPRKPMTPGRPPLPSKINSFYDESLNTGNQSPLVPMPPPPPPPPFKMPGFKFVVRGDYVRLQSSHSSRSNSPDLDFTDTPPTSTPVTPTTMEGGEAGVSVFCPSPDVNTKADTFIARFRAGLRMEKVNSFKEKQELSTSRRSPRSKPSLS